MGRLCHRQSEARRRGPRPCHRRPVRRDLAVAAIVPRLTMRCRCRLALTFLFALADRVIAANASGELPRAKVIIDRETAPWESQQVQEPCILPNPKDPSRLVMFYSGVPKSNRRLCYVGKAWALASDPFTWHQDAANPVFGPLEDNWDSGSLRLDCVLHVPEEDAYYIYYSGTMESVQDKIGLAICPVGL